MDFVLAEHLNRSSIKNKLFDFIQLQVHEDRWFTTGHYLSKVGSVSTCLSGQLTWIYDLGGTPESLKQVEWKKERQKERRKETERRTKREITW